MKVISKLFFALSLSAMASSMAGQTVSDRFGNRYSLDDIQVLNPGQLPGFEQRGGLYQRAPRGSSTWSSSTRLE